MMKRLKFFAKLFFVCAFFVFGFSAHAENIDPNEVGNNAATLVDTGDPVFFDCLGCNVNVTDSLVTGQVYSTYTGWISLQYDTGGIVNNGAGTLTGFALGTDSGLVNFSPEGGGVFIDPDTGYFSGVATSVNRGDIVFSCPGPSCVETGWRPPVETCLDPDAINQGEPLPCEYGGNGGCSGDSCDPDPEDVCEDDTAINFGEEGICFYDGTLQGCTDDTAINYNPDATVDDGSCIPAEDPPDDGEYCDEVGALNYLAPGECFFDGDIEDEDPDSDSDPVDGDDPVGEDDDPDTGGDDPTDGSDDDPENPNEDGDGSSDNNEDPDNDDNDGVGIIFGGDTEELVEYVSDLIGFDSKNLTFLAGIFFFVGLFKILPFKEGHLILSFLGFYSTRRFWGTVYDSETKQPLDPVIVTLRDYEGNEIDSAITDLDGRYGFIVDSGKYKITAEKTDYQFPSTKLAGKSRDQLYRNLYFGGEINVGEPDEVISLNIPMDPINFNWNEEAKRDMSVMRFHRSWDVFISAVSRILFFSGLILSIIVVAIDPNILNFIILGLYLVVLALYVSGVRHRPRGVVKDVSGRPIPNAIVRVFSAATDREVKHVVTGKYGRYYLLIPKGTYYMTVEVRQPDGFYRQISKSELIGVKNGYINEKIKTFYNSQI